MSHFPLLAFLLLSTADVLLLDEPTNHLSILAVLWLARELSTHPAWNDRIIVIVSHDRYFIDEVCKDVLHISGVAQRLTQSKGNYSLWASRRAEQQKTYAKEKALQEAEVKKLEDYAGHGFKYGGSSSQINKMQMKAKQAEKLKEAAKIHADELAALQEDMELPLKIASGGELDGFVIQISGVRFAYPGGPDLFKNVELGIMSNSRVCLMVGVCRMIFAVCKLIGTTCCQLTKDFVALLVSYPSSPTIYRYMPSFSREKTETARPL